MAPRDDLSRVRRIALSLPDVEEGTTYGCPAFKAGGKPFAWMPVKAGVEPGSLGVRMSFLERDYRIASHPDIYYCIPHYKDYPAVLVRVWLLKDADLRELLESGYEFVLSEAKRKKKRAR